MLRQRIITAVVLVLALATVLFCLPYRGFALCMVLVFALAAWEWGNLAGIEKSWHKILYALICAGLFLVWVFSGIPVSGILTLCLFLAVAGWGVALFAVIRYPESVAWYKPITLLVMGVWLLLPAFISLLVLHTLESDGRLILLVIGSIAAADIGAYFSGRAFGKRKLAVAVSPGKTWEGFFGGILANILLALTVAVYQSMPVIDALLFVFLIVVTAMASVLGDLFESMVKRERGIKDSGHLLPGHGGVLDRIDGWMAALPVFTLLYLLAR